MRKGRLQLIDCATLKATPATAARRRVKAMPKPAALVDCPSCSGRTFMDCRTGMFRRGSKITGGARGFVCVVCLAAGRVVVID